MYLVGQFVPNKTKNKTYGPYWVLCKNIRVPGKKHPIRKHLVYFGKKKPTLHEAMEAYHIKTGETLTPQDFELEYGEIRSVLSEQKKVPVESES